MALVGLYTSYMTLCDEDGNLLTGDAGLSDNGIIEIDHKYFGSSEASISNLMGKTEPIVGNNQVQAQILDPASPSVSYTVNNLDYDLEQKILGYVKSGLGYEPAQSPVYGGLVIVSQTLDRLHKIYYAFPQGVYSLTKLDIKSDTDTKVSMVQDALTFNAQACANINDQTHKTYSDAATSFSLDAMFKELYPNYAGSTTGTTTIPATGK